MTTLILRWGIRAVAFYAALLIVPGLQADNPNWQSYIWLALIFGLIYVLVRPLQNFLKAPLILLDLIMLLIYTAMLYLTSSVGEIIGLGLSIANFWAAFLGALVINIISMVMTMFEPKAQQPLSEK